MSVSSFLSSFYFVPFAVSFGAIDGPAEPGGSSYPLSNSIFRLFEIRIAAVLCCSCDVIVVLVLGLVPAIRFHIAPFSFRFLPLLFFTCCLCFHTALLPAPDLDFGTSTSGKLDWTGPGRGSIIGIRTGLGLPDRIGRDWALEVVGPLVRRGLDGDGRTGFGFIARIRVLCPECKGGVQRASLCGATTSKKKTQKRQVF